MTDPAQHYYQEAPNAADERLTELAKYVKKMLWWDQEIERINATLEHANNCRKQLSESMIPELAASLGIEGLTMDDGSKVKVEKFYTGSISAERSAEAFKWLREHGHDSLIKNQISLEFSKGQDEYVGKILALLNKNKVLNEIGVAPAHKESVHYQTLKAFIKEQMEAGNDIPQETLGVFVGKKTTVKPAKT